MSKFKLEFTLKQHTPIIHFQSEQSGATLRATELKPKFDRFLLEQFTKEGIDYSSFLISGQEKALGYKIKIEADLSTSTSIDKRNPLFFGNMGDGKDKKFKEHKKEFEIIFFTFNKKLKNILEEKFESFLANTNFGTRQSKGFGGFYIEGKSFDKDLIEHNVYSFSSSKGSWDKDIKLFYSFLRQGINVPRGKNLFYSKPAIFLYAKSKGWEWDKKAIKAHFFSDDLSSQQKKYNQESPVNYSSEEKYLLRDLFGLSSEQSWMSYNNATIKKEHSDIERYKSSITFKFIDNRVYFWADKSFEEILGKTFKITTRGNPLNLSTPKHFSFDEFFEFVKTIDLSSVVEKKFHSQDEYKSLTRMLNNMKVAS